LEPSASEANAVTPTESPADAASETESAAASASATAETSNSLLSVTAMSKLCVELEPSSEVAVTSICIDCADSKSRPLGSATVTSPVSASMAKASLGFSLSE
jgi:uncharacterized lipoprotein YbaY